MRLTELFHLANNETKLSHETYLKITHLDIRDFSMMEEIKKARVFSKNMKKEKSTEIDKNKNKNKKRVEHFDLFE